MLKYLGGAAIHGVPARDLTDDEGKTFGAIIAEQEKLTGTKLYQPIEAKAKSSTKAKGDD